NSTSRTVAQTFRSLSAVGVGQGFSPAYIMLCRRGVSPATSIQRELLAKRLDFTLHAPELGVVVRRGKRAEDQLADAIHLALAHAPGGDGRRADADAAGHHGRILIERDRVLVDGDPRLAERGFGGVAAMSV